MKRALLIAFNETRLFLIDKGDMAFSLLLPIVTFALMYGAFGGSNDFEATARIVDEDGGAYATRLIEQLDAVDGVSIEMLTAKDADAKLERSDLLLVLFIPAGFSDSLVSEGKANLVFKQRGNGGDEGQIMASIIRSIVEDMNREFQVRDRVSNIVADTDISAAHIEAVAQQYLEEERESPSVTVTEEVSSGGPDFINLFLPGIVTMYVLFSLALNARAIVEERKRGTLERLLTTRLSVGELFSGKFLASVARGFVQTVILMGLGYAVFQVFTPVSFIYSLVIVLIYAAAAGALGLIIASLARTEDAAIWIGVFITMFMVMLGGTFFEVAEGSVLHTLGYFSLNTYANEALRAVLAEGGGLGDAGIQLIVLAAVAAVGLFIARSVFKAIPGGK